MDYYTYYTIKEICKLYHWYNSFGEGHCELLAIKQGGTYSDDEVKCSEENCPILEVFRELQQNEKKM